VKTITIRLPDVEAAMMVEAQKKNKAYRDIFSFLLYKIREEYERLSKDTGS